MSTPQLGGKFLRSSSVPPLLALLLSSRALAPAKYIVKTFWQVTWSSLPQKSWAAVVKWDACCYLSEIHSLCQFRRVETAILFHDPSEWLRWQRTPQGREKGIRSGSHLHGENRQRADGNTDKHTEKQYPRQCRGGYLGPDAFGFLFQLTLLRAHGKGGEQGLCIGKWEGRVNVSQTFAASFPLGSPTYIFLILFPASIYS